MSDSRQYDTIAETPIKEILRATGNLKNGKLPREAKDKMTQDLQAGELATLPQAEQEITMERVIRLYEYSLVCFAKAFQSIPAEDVDAFEQNKAAGQPVNDLAVYKAIAAAYTAIEERNSHAGESAASTMLRLGAKNGFFSIRQGIANNSISKAKTTEGNQHTDAVTGTAFFTGKSFTIAIPKYSSLAGLRTSTNQLLDALVIAFTAGGAKNPTVEMSLTDYMTIRELKDRKEAKKRAAEDLDVLRTMSIQWTEKRRKKTKSYGFINIADSGFVHKDGTINFTFGKTFCEVLQKYPTMPYPAQLLTINPKRTPNSYFLLRKLSEHKRMNAGHSNEDTISVKTLLEAAVCIPSYHEVMQRDRAVAKHIIDPFERGLDALGDVLTWHYCHKLNTPLTDDELTSMDYSVFEKLLVHIYWQNYPNQTQLIEGRAAAQKRREQAAKKRTKKGQTAVKSGGNWGVKRS